jgi:hypothetical protein
MGSCCGPYSAATRLCSSYSSSEVKMSLLVPSLSPRRPALTAPAPPRPATASIHAHVVRGGVLCPRGGEDHRWLLLIAPSYRSDMGRVRGQSSAGSEWLQVAVVGEEGQLPPSPPPRRHIPALLPLWPAVLSLREFCEPVPHTEACLAAYGVNRLVRKLELEMASRLASNACTPPVHLRWRIISGKKWEKRFFELH